MSKFLDYGGLSYYHGKVQGEIDQLALELNGIQAVTISLSENTTAGNGIPATPARELTTVLKAGRRYNISWTGLTSLVKNLTFYTRSSSDTYVGSYWNGSQETSGSFSATVSSFDVIPTADVYKLRIYASDSNVVGTGTVQITITNYPGDGIVGHQIKGWVLSESFTLASATRNSDGDVTAANVVWPDGISGTLSITRNTDGAATQMIATHGSDSYTLNITRDSLGNVTATNFS